jgi:hypothetical protein
LNERCCKRELDVSSGFNKHPEYDPKESAASQQRHLRKSSANVVFVPPLDSAAEKVGYMVFKDSKVHFFQWPCGEFIYISSAWD